MYQILRPIILHIRKILSNHKKIREYFKLDTVVSSTMPTWDKAISLARFVAENIPHANQKINPKRLLML